MSNLFRDAKDLAQCPSKVVVTASMEHILSFFKTSSRRLTVNLTRREVVQTLLQFESVVKLNLKTQVC